MNNEQTIRIAVAQSLDGHLACCGPGDFGEDHDDAMSAAMCWLMDGGHLPAALYWVEVTLPPIPSVPELRAQVAAGSFPKSLFDYIAEGSA